MPYNPPDMDFLFSSGRGLATVAAVVGMIVVGACSGGQGDLPKREVAPAESGPAGSTDSKGTTGPGGSSGGASSGAPAGKDASAAPDAGSDAGEGEAPDCNDACAKAFSCKMVSSPTGCVCSGKAASPACVACWLANTCDDLKDYACYEACN